MKRVFNKIWIYLKSIPLYGYILGAGIIFFQWGLYTLAQIIVKYSGYTARGYIPFLPMDDKIPLLIGFIIIYVLSYPHWIITFIIASKTNKNEYLDMIFGAILAVLIGFIIFCAVPTYIDRTKDIWIQQNKNNTGFLYDLWRFICSADGDGGKYGFNMCPSFHCLFATYSYLIVMRRKNIKIGFRIYVLIMMILICMSTVFCKQHYFVDILGGVGLALICYYLSYIIKPVTRYLEYKKKKEESL